MRRPVLFFFVFLLVQFVFSDGDLATGNPADQPFQPEVAIPPSFPDSSSSSSPVADATPEPFEVVDPPPVQTQTDDFVEEDVDFDFEDEDVDFDFEDEDVDFDFEDEDDENEDDDSLTIQEALDLLNQIDDSLDVLSLDEVFDVSSVDVEEIEITFIPLPPAEDLPRPQCHENHPDGMPHHPDEMNHQQHHPDGMNHHQHGADYHHPPHQMPHHHADGMDHANQLHEGMSPDGMPPPYDTYHHHGRHGYFGILVCSSVALLFLSSILCCCCGSRSRFDDDEEAYRPVQSFEPSHEEDQIIEMVQQQSLAEYTAAQQQQQHVASYYPQVPASSYSYDSGVAYMRVPVMSPEAYAHYLAAAATATPSAPPRDV